MSIFLAIDRSLDGAIRESHYSGKIGREAKNLSEILEFCPNIRPISYPSFHRELFVTLLYLTKDQQVRAATAALAANWHSNCKHLGSRPC